MRINCNYHPQPLANGTPVALSFDSNRSYLCVVPTADTVVTFDGTQVGFTIKAGTVWSPYPAPSNALSFSGEGLIITG